MPRTSSRRCCPQNSRPGRPHNRSTAAGATPASFMSYGIAKRTSRRGDNFGNGEIEGVIARDGGACSRHLGVASDALARRARLSHRRGAARGLLIRGLHPGPLLFIEQKEFVWSDTKTFKNS